MGQYISPAIISSICADGIAEHRDHWPSGVPCELYCFMHKDTLLPGDIGKPALERMANLRDDTQVQAVADAIDTLFYRPNNPIDVIGLASFFPEVSSPSALSGPVENACNAIVFLVRLAKRLREKAADRRGTIGPSIIELVGGSRIDGVWTGSARNSPPKSETPPDYFAKQVSQPSAISRLCQTLEVAVQRATLKDSGIRFALELEPGPLYVINSLKALCLLYRALEKRQLLDCVGFNLDIAHWTLCGISPRKILNDIARDPQAAVPEGNGVKWNQLLSQIVHAHISDHGHGHFGDAPLLDVGLGVCSDDECTRQIFRDWLSLLAEFSGIPDLTNRARPDKSPPFSRFISLELEACVGTEVVHKSVERLRDLMAGQPES